MQFLMWVSKTWLFLQEDKSETLPCFSFKCDTKLELTLPFFSYRGLRTPINPGNRGSLLMLGLPNACWLYSSKDQHKIWSTLAQQYTFQRPGIPLTGDYLNFLGADNFCSQNIWKCLFYHGSLLYLTWRLRWIKDYWQVRFSRT